MPLTPCWYFPAPCNIHASAIFSGQCPCTPSLCCTIGVRLWERPSKRGWRTCPWPAPLPRNVCGLNSCRSQVSWIWGRPGALGNDATRFCSSARKRVLAVDTQRIFPWKDWLVLLCGKPGPPLPFASGASYKMAQVTQTAVTALKCGVFRAWHDRDAASRLN